MHLRLPTFRAAGTAALLVVILISGSCRRGNSAAQKQIEPVYNPQTGKLELLKYDSNGDGKVDIWSHMDGARVVRIEIDHDQDGRFDRWEYYGAEQKVEKVGVSRLNDGKEDAWVYAAPDGSIVRRDLSTARNGKVTRIERYENEQLVSAEEDSDQDGQIDKWETYDGDRLASVAFDTSRLGRPDRRLIYGPDGSVRLERDPSGTGDFAAVSEQRSPAARRSGPQPSTP